MNCYLMCVVWKTLSRLPLEIRTDWAREGDDFAFLEKELHSVRFKHGMKGVKQQQMLLLW